MKIKSKISNKTLVTRIAIAIAISCGATAFYLISTSSSQNDNEQVLNPTRSETDIQQAKELASDPAKKETRSNTDTPPPVMIDENTGKGIVSMSTSSDILDKTLYIRGGINNSVEHDGSCYAELTSPSGNIVRKETSLLQNATTTDCKTIAIPLTELSTGHWTFTLNYSSNTKAGKSSEASFDI